MITRLRVMLAAALAVGSVVVATASGPGEAAANQRTLFDHTGAQTRNSYYDPTKAGVDNQPASYVSPVNLRDGRVYVKLEILDKPSNILMWPQLCMWRHQGTALYKYETCSAEQAIPLSTEGVYYADLGVPGRWWKKNGTWDWGQQADVMRIMFKDPVSRKLFLDGSCGNACYPGDVTKHVPVRLRAEVIMVPAGASLTPPSDWRGGCPTSWSSLCSGGPTTTTPSGTTTTTTAPSATTTTTTTAPPADADVPAPPSGSGKSVLLIGGATPASGDRPYIDALRSFGYTVTPIDVDVVTAGDLAGVDAAILSSSVVPSAVPGFLATTSTPLLVSEAYVMDDLGLARTAGDGPLRNSLTILGGHPIAAGVAGTVRTSTASNYVTASPSPAASIIATSGGEPSVYAYDPGDPMASGNAPARRVGWFMSYRTPGDANTNAFNLLGHAVAWLTDGATPPTTTTTTTTTTSTTTTTTTTTVAPPTSPPPAGGGDVLFVTNNGRFPSGDRPMRDALTAAGYSVSAVADTAVTRAMTDAADVVVITSSVLPNEVPTFLRTAPTPLLVSETYALQRLGLSGAGSETANQTRLAVNAGHPIADGLNGSTLVSDPTAFNSAFPAASADVVATLNGSSRPAIFAYDAGDAMSNGSAPAKRVGFHFSYGAPPEANSAGMALFVNAVDWLAS